MALKFYIQVKGKVSGPLSGSELMSLAQLGKLLPTDMVRQDGSDKWVQANRIRNTAFGSSNLIVEAEIKRYLGFSQRTNPKHLALITVQSISTPNARNYPTVLAGVKI